MRRVVLFAIAVCLIASGAWKQFGGGNSTGETSRGEISSGPRVERASSAPDITKTWGNPATLPDHFVRHGADFHARDAEDYARQAWAFGERAKAGGLLVKIDEDGVRRVFDPQTGAFAAFNADGTTKTFFKPNSRDYFARQPGRLMKRW